jgi:glycosyltransferase involved in cell wall biosynthesis
MVTLIVATLGRSCELERLLGSLEKQSYRSFEVIIVDQNEDDRLAFTLQSHPGLRLRHLHSPRGLSRGRNVGLAHASGDIVAIPDDDCWYPENLLASVATWFDSHPEFSGVSGIKRAADDTPVGPRWPKRACEVFAKTLWQCGISSAVFMRRTLTDRVGLFDENIGVGAPTRYQSGEETDYLLRALECGLRIAYEPAISVHHPPLNSIDRLQRNTYNFALGAGYVMRRHGFSWWYLCDRLMRSLGGSAVSLMRGDIALAGIYWKRSMGQFQGYLAARND